MKKPFGIRATLASMIFTFTMTIGVLGAHTGTALADNDGRGHEGREQDRDWRNHERQAHNWHRRHIYHGNHEQQYIQEDPYVVYAPPTVIEPPQGLNVIIPLNFR